MNATVIGKPLTHRQELIWAEHVLARDVPANNNLVCFEFQRHLDPDRFVAAFDAVVAATDVLRTVVRVNGDQPEQCVLGALEEGQCEVLDFSAESDPRAAFEAWRDDRCCRLFDIERCMFDSVLVMLDSTCIWYFCQHHLICDAWSFALIFKRTADQYVNRNAVAAQSPYARYIGYEAKYRASDACAASNEFWRQRPPVQTLQPYGASVEDKSAAMFRRKLELGQERSSKIRALAETDGFKSVTPSLSVSLLFTTAVFAYLYRVSGNERIGIGSPVANRPSRWAKETVGLFMEVCSFQADIDPGDTFASLHGRTLLEGERTLPHARCSVGNPVHDKRFDVMLNFHNAKFPSFCGVPVSAEISNALLAYSAGNHQSDRAIGLANETMTFQVLDFGDTGSFELYLDFNRGVFSEELAQAATAHFVNLLDAFLRDPHMPIDAAPLSSPDERRRAREAVARDDNPLVWVNEQFHRWARLDPDRVAVRDATTVLSYGELENRVAAVHRVLVEAGVEPGDRIAIYMPRSVDLVAALIGTMDAGCTYVPLDPKHPPERTRLILEDVSPALVLTAPPGANGAELEGVQQASLGPGWHERARGAPLEARERAELAYIIFTSGSTGTPKGVEVPHTALANFMGSMTHSPGIAETDRLLAVTTVSFDIAALELLLPLTAGAALVVADEETCLDPKRLANTIDSEGITAMQATPATWQMLIESGWQGAEGLRILCGGEALPRTLADDLLARAEAVWNLYGPTETTIWSSRSRVRAGTGPIELGDPIDRTYFRVLTPERELTPDGAPGELYIGGAGLARGYWNKTDLTAERFVEDPLAPSSTIYRTGDRVRQRTHGGLEYLGRSDFQIKVRGFRIEAGEIEAALKARADIVDAVVIARGEQVSERRLVAYFVAAGDVELDSSDLASELSSKLPRYMVPAQWTQLSSLPRTANGKLDRAALPEPAHSSNSVRAELPEDDLEVELAALWREVLGGVEVGRRDDFFALGGNSLLAVTMLTRVGSLFDVEIPFAEFFEDPSVAGLGLLLSSGVGGEGASSAAVRLNQDGPERPLFCMGGVHLYQDLARALNETIPVYGVYVHEEQKWMSAVRDGTDDGLPTAESLATHYIDVIRATQPNGPYRLAGLSYGGVLAYEIAQQLMAAGATVQALILLDVRLPHAIAKAGGLGQYAKYLLRRALRQRRERKRALREADIDRLKVDEVNSYEKRIAPYSGPVLLCRALEGWRGTVEKDQTLGWGKVVGDLELADCPGNHLSVIRDANAATVAAAIVRYLEKLEDARVSRNGAEAVALKQSGNTLGDAVDARELRVE